MQVQQGKAEDAAAKVTQFVKDIEDQVGWTTQLPWTPGDLNQRRFDALRLLHQVPAITELALCSIRKGTNSCMCHVLRSMSSAAIAICPRSRNSREAHGHRVYYGPVYFRHQSEP